MAYSSEVRFEWDPAKAEANRRRHGVSFEEASALFAEGAVVVELFDAAHSDVEDRFVVLGHAARGLIFVVYTEREEGAIRILGAGPATRRKTSVFARTITGEGP